jgi:type IV secretion system protein VirB10
MMGMSDLFKTAKNKHVTESNAEDGVPDLNGGPSTLKAAANAALKKQNEARERENADNTAVENDGLPSVNKAKGGNKMVTTLIAIAALAVVVALLVAVNVDKGPKKKKAEPEQIQNTLPPLVVPVAPPPIVMSSVSVATPGALGPLGAQVPSIKPGAPGTQPIEIQGGKPPGIGSKGSTVKPVPDWTDRKMSGALLLPTQLGSGSASSSAAKPVVLEGDSTPSLFAPTGRPAAGGNDLSARLEPTITKGVSAAMLADRNFLITKGTTLDCALETALDSTVPGLTTCRLTRDVYSDNGQIILLDRGSQLTGEYQGGLKQGQVRLFILWSRAKTPNGVVVSLNSPGTDALGRSGMEGWVDNHFMERFGAAILMSFIQGTVASMANNTGGGTTNIYGSTATAGEKVIEKILDASVGIPPTIVKNQGDHIQVMVARDLDFSSVYSLQVKK